MLNPRKTDRVEVLRAPPSDRYKWTALFIATLGMLMATIDSSIVLIVMPAMFRGVGINPLEPSNTFYLLWMILGFLVVTSVLVVSLGRLGDIYGRVRIYNRASPSSPSSRWSFRSPGCTDTRRASG
jgi:hypothetical protein